MTQRRQGLALLLLLWPTAAFLPPPSPRTRVLPVTARRPSTWLRVFATNANDANPGLTRAEIAGELEMVAQTWRVWYP